MSPQAVIAIAVGIAALKVGGATVLFVAYPARIRTHGRPIRQYFSGVWPAVQLGNVLPAGLTMADRYLRK